MNTNSYPSKDNRTNIYIYYESLKYTKISQIPKALPFDLISNIGGILGLFVGLSFVSLFEIAELIIEVGFVFLSNSFHSNSSEKTSNQETLELKLNSIMETLKKDQQHLSERLDQFEHLHEININATSQQTESLSSSFNKME